MYFDVQTIANIVTFLGLRQPVLSLEFFIENNVQENLSLCLSALSERFFLGATDIEEEDVWNWFNGVPVKREEFELNNPNNYNMSQHCLAYEDDGFDDKRCQRSLAFVCEVPTVAAYNNINHQTP